MFSILKIKMFSILKIKMFSIDAYWNEEFVFARCIHADIQCIFNVMIFLLEFIAMLYKIIKELTDIIIQFLMRFYNYTLNVNIGYAYGNNKTVSKHHDFQQQWLLLLCFSSSSYARGLC